MGIIYSERNWKSLGCKYTIRTDCIDIGTLVGYVFKIPYRDIEKIELKGPLVIWDLYKRKKLFSSYVFHVLKNDFADFFQHVCIKKQSGFWKEIRITPKEPEKFCSIVRAHMAKVNKQVK